MKYLLSFILLCGMLTGCTGNKVHHGGIQLDGMYKEVQILDRKTGFKLNIHGDEVYILIAKDGSIFTTCHDLYANGVCFNIETFDSSRYELIDLGVSISI